MYFSLYLILLLNTITVLITADSTKSPSTNTSTTIIKNSKPPQNVDQKIPVSEDDDSTIQESYRALLVFGVISLTCGIYFYYKLKKIREKERVHYGILDDREFELRHLSLTDDEDDDLSGHPTGRKKKSFLNALNESDDEYTTLYDSRKGSSKKKFTEYV